MWFARIRRGTLCVETYAGKRFFAPSFFQRLYLFWLFRHFHRLPLNVLGARDRACVERVCSRKGVAGDPELVVGIVECELLPPKKASQPAPLFQPGAAQIKRAR